MSSYGTRHYIKPRQFIIDTDFIIIIIIFCEAFTWTLQSRKMITTTYLALWACEPIQDALSLSLLSLWVQIFFIQSGRDMSHEVVLERKGERRK
jgi:hypothetical protein